MNNCEIWEIEITIQMDIVSNVAEICLNQSDDPDLIKIELTPITDDKQSNLDHFLLKTQFIFHKKNIKTTTPEITNFGNQLIDGIISRFCFISNAPVIKISKPIFTHQYPKTKKYRKIIPPSEQVFIHPPKLIDNFDLIISKIDIRVSKALIFVNESLITSDLVGSFVFLWSSLEILVGLFEVNDFEAKKCSKCGWVYQKEPGIKEGITYVLTNKLSVDEELINILWKIRNNISHHGLTLSESELLHIESNRNSLYVIVRELINTQIGYPKDGYLGDIPFSPYSGIYLDFEYVVP